MPADTNSSNSGPYAPYAQLVKMLMPSAGSVAVYDCDAELVWCSDGYERPDLRMLLEEQRVSETVASRGRVDTTREGVAVFISGLRAADARPLGSVVIELGSGTRSTPSMVVSMLRPVLDCLERQLDLERSTLVADRSAGFELLLGVDEQDRQDASALSELLRHCVKQLGCVTGALLVPDKNTEISCTIDDTIERSQLLDRTQKHLLAWAQLNNRPMVVNRGAAGTDAPYKILSCPLRDPQRRVIGLIALFRTNDAEDFEERDVRILEFVGRKAISILESDHDSLTGLTNPLIFERRAQKVLDQAQGEGEGSALLYIDIDKIAAINETFGLSAGDEVIQRVGELARLAAGVSGLVSRIVGDRFAVLLPNETLGTASDVAARILGAVNQLGYIHGSETLPVSVSIGLVVGKPGERLPHVLAAAELACKRAKRDGAGRMVAVEDASELAPAPTRQLIAASDLHEALRSNRFQLDAQPIVGLRARTDQIVGYELLVRLRGPAGEILAPDKFLDACAHYGLLPALDRWALCSAIEALRPHAQTLASSSSFFTLNVSAQSIENRKYAAFALESLAAAGLSPALVCFELKEAAAVTNLSAAEAFIRDVTAAKAKVALDDFGAGLSSLAYLKRLPVSYLKIDGRFVRRMTNDRIAESIVSGIARAARTLGVLTVAEHVESAAVADRLRELEVTLGQGFHLGRPAPLAEVVPQALPTATVARLNTRA